jgi:cytochrome P450
MLLFADPPRHDRLRQLLESSFSPELHAFAIRRAEDLAPVLLDMALAEEAPDLVQGFAVPFPVLVMSEVLGIPAEERTRVKRWSTDIVAITDLRSSPDALARAMRATGEVAEYLGGLLRERRRSPREDILSRMISAHVDGQALSDEEIMANGILFLAAGHETTVGLLGYGTQALLDHRDEAARFASGEIPVTHVVEELLRYTSPVQMTFRIAHERVEFQGSTIEAGDAVALVIGSANRDPAEFPEAGSLRLGRGARRHLAFGAGAHHCLGSTVARAEARAAFRALAPLLGQMSYERSELRRTDNFLFRALSALPVRVR